MRGAKNGPSSRSTRWCSRPPSSLPGAASARIPFRNNGFAKMTMPAVVLTTDGRIAPQDRPRPTLRPDQVLVEVDLCGICGSDLHAWRLPQVYRGDCILGHESTGRIAEVGDDVADWGGGQRVAVNPNRHVDRTCAE